MDVTRKHCFTTDGNSDVANGFGELWLIAVTSWKNKRALQFTYNVVISEKQKNVFFFESHIASQLIRYTYVHWLLFIIVHSRTQSIKHIGLKKKKNRKERQTYWHKRSDVFRIRIKELASVNPYYKSFQIIIGVSYTVQLT